ncbi:hypothetical protein HDU93_009128 [Gonapodya sp. JEL0774]|nr:hypothetical protein HDU93_009128 [Gonapodya sp. JEL0774]
MLSEHLPRCPYEAIKGHLDKQRVVNERLTRENEALRKQMFLLTTELTTLRQQFNVATTGQTRSTRVSLSQQDDGNMPRGLDASEGTWNVEDILTADMNLHPEGFISGIPPDTSQLSVGVLRYPPLDVGIPPFAIQELAAENERLSNEVAALRGQLETTELRNNVAIMNESVKVRDEIHGLRAMCHQLQAQILLLLDIPRKGVVGGGVVAGGGPAVGNQGPRSAVDALEGLTATANLVAAISGARGSRNSRRVGTSAPPSPQSPGSSEGTTSAVSSSTSHTNVLKLDNREGTLHDGGETEGRPEVTKAGLLEPAGLIVVEDEELATVELLIAEVIVAVLTPP